MIEAVNKIMKKLDEDPDEKKYNETDIRYYYFDLDISYEDFIDIVYEVNDETPEGTMCWPNWEENSNRFIFSVQTSEEFKNKEIPDPIGSNKLQTPDSTDENILNP